MGIIDYDRLEPPPILRGAEGRRMHDAALLEYSDAVGALLELGRELEQAARGYKAARRRCQQAKLHVKADFPRALTAALEAIEEG